MDNFNFAGKDYFIEEVLGIVDKELTVLKVKQDNIRFTGLDISAVDDGFEIEMADYINSLRDIKKIRKVEKDENLTKNEIKEYQKVTRKWSWLTQGMRPNFSFMALQMSKKNNCRHLEN